MAACVCLQIDQAFTRLGLSGMLSIKGTTLGLPREQGLARTTLAKGYTGHEAKQRDAAPGALATIPPRLGCPC